MEVAIRVRCSSHEELERKLNEHPEPTVLWDHLEGRKTYFASDLKGRVAVR
jgi:hypothetical protein